MNYIHSRKFAGVEKLFGTKKFERLIQSHILIVGIGGVGSWTVEALVRSGIQEITVVDPDHICESNVNRQIHAVTSTIGQSKLDAIYKRVMSINPNCSVHLIDEFIDSNNIFQLNGKFSAIADCCDQIHAKTLLVMYATEKCIPIFISGSTGGKTSMDKIMSTDLNLVKNDRLLSKLRYNLRKRYSNFFSSKKMGIQASWIDEIAVFNKTGEFYSGLSCSGYGSVVTVTASIGFSIAGNIINNVIK